MIDVSYGILHYNPGANLDARSAFLHAVDSLAIHKSKNLTSEVFIIDQGNPFQESEISRGLAEYYDFNYIALKKNVGISRGINLIANVARGEFISLVTSDVEFTAGLDESLLTTLNCHKDIWQICPASNQSDLIYQRQGFTSGGVVLTLAQELTIQFWRRKAFETIGFFDERWKACYENMDYALRIFLAGGYAAISHEAFCPHDYHMCMKSGAREQSYDDYIGDNGTFDPSPLAAMWHAKWPHLQHVIDLYTPLSSNDDLRRTSIKQAYSDNIYLPYIQKVDY